MRSPTLARHLATLDAQRRDLFARLEGSPPADLWRRPGGGLWSAGQNLEHVDAMMRFFRRLYAVVLPLQRPLAWLRRRRPFAAEMRLDASRLSSLPALPGLRPRDRRSAPVLFREMRRRLDAERAALEALLASVPEEVAGHVVLWDPFTGVFNLPQMIDVLGQHEAHHFAFVHALLDAGAVHRR